jgi:hypothetical protein
VPRGGFRGGFRGGSPYGHDVHCDGYLRVLCDQLDGLYDCYDGHHGCLYDCFGGLYDENHVSVPCL